MHFFVLFNKMCCSKCHDTFIMYQYRDTIKKYHTQRWISPECDLTEKHGVERPGATVEVGCGEPRRCLLRRGLVWESYCALFPKIFFNFQVKMQGFMHF